MTVAYDQVKKSLRDVLIANTTLAAIPIYPSHISTFRNPTFPCITITRRGGGTERHWIGTDSEYQIDVWTKGVDTGGTYVENDGLWALYNEVRKTINLKTIPGITFLCKEMNVRDDLYENVNRVWRLMALYRVMFENVV